MASDDDVVGVDTAMPDFSRFAIRSMKTCSEVTVMQRFEAFAPKSCRGLRQVAHAVTAANRLRIGKEKKQLRPDFVTITGHANGQLQIRNFDTGKIIASGQHFNNASVTCLCVTNSYIYTAVAQATRASTDYCDVYVWDMTNLSKIHHTLEGHTERVSCIAAPYWRETTPVTGSVDKTIMIWDVTQGRSPVHTLRGHTMMVKHLLLTADCIVSGSSDQSLRVWRWSGEAVDCFETAHAGPVQYLSFGMTPQTIISACGGGAVRETAIEPETAKLTSLWQSRPAKGQVLDVAFDANYVMSSTLDAGNVHFYIRAKQINKSFPLSRNSNVAIRALELDAAREFLLTGDDAGALEVWSYKKAHLGIPPAPLLRMEPHTYAVTNILLDKHPSGQWERIFSCSNDHSIVVLTLPTDDNPATPLAKPLCCLEEIQPTGTIVTNTDQNRCLLWNATRMLCKSDYASVGGTGLLEGHTQPVSGILYIKDFPKLLTIGEDGWLIVWDVTLYDEVKFSDEELLTIEAKHELKGPATTISENFNEIVAVGGSKAHHGTVQLLNFVSGEEILSFTTPSLPLRIAFVGLPMEGLSQVIVQLANGDVVLHDAAGLATATIFSLGDLLERSHDMPDALVLPFLHWVDASFEPPQSTVITCKQQIVKEQRIVLDGGGRLVEARQNWAFKAPSDVTVMTLVQNSNLRCVVGTREGVFTVVDKKGKVRCDVHWDGGVESQDAAGPLGVTPRRHSYCSAEDSQKPGSPPCSCAYSSHTARVIAFGFEDGCIVIVDTTQLRATQRFFPLNGPIMHIRVCPSTRRIVTASDAEMRIDVLWERDDRLVQP
ncbi:WD repeat-containing protein 5-like protein [Diplonema papillatum]|nr:WD repeat-containing protein 5-like protein [Diplonema papillatum]